MTRTRTAPPTPIPVKIQRANVENKKLAENSIAPQLTLYEDPIPVDSPHLIAPEKYQVGQDQHGGGARCEGSVEPAASSWGEELGLWGKGKKTSHHKGEK